MKKTFYFVFLFLASFNLFASGFSKPTTDIGLSLFSVKEEALLSRGTAVIFESHFNYQVGNEFKLNFWPVASFISGQQTSRDPQSPLTNSIYLKEASIEKEIAPHLTNKLGALYQKDILPGIAGQTKSLPALSIGYSEKYNKHELSLVTEAAVPTSSGVATNTNELKSNSTLIATSAFIKSDWNAKIQTRLNYSYFNFNELSSQMATDSINRGNTVIRLNSSTQVFAYEYAGHELQLTLNYIFNDKYDLNLKNDFIVNTGAPTTKRSGYYLLLEPGMRLNSQNKISLQLEHYHVQSDAILAIFSDSTYGRTNRDGYRYGINLESKEYELQFMFAHSKLIQSNPFQSDDTAFFINLSLRNIQL